MTAPASVADETFARGLPANDQIWLLSWLSWEEPGLVACAVAALEDYHAGTSPCAGRRKARHKERYWEKRREKRRAGVV